MENKQPIEPVIYFVHPLISGKKEKEKVNI